MSGLESVGLTFDTDWAPDFVIEHTVRLLEKYEVKSTFFCTNINKVLRDADLTEVGIHPGFDNTLSLEDDTQRLRRIFPSAVGVRTHSLIQSSPLTILFTKSGLKYDSSLLLWEQWGLKPFRDWNGLVRVPIFWEDDLHLLSERELRLESINFRTPGMKVFDFHPIHIFLNTSDLKTYNNYKEDRENIERYISDGDGIGSMFINLLEFIKKNDITTFKLAEVTKNGFQ